MRWLGVRFGRERDGASVEGRVVIAETIATHRRAERLGVPSPIAQTLQDLLDDALHRRRLPNRRRNETHSVAIDGTRLTATVGFDGDSRPAEVFLDGATDGSGLAAVLADASVVISIAPAARHRRGRTGLKLRR